MCAACAVMVVTAVAVGRSTLFAREPETPAPALLETSEAQRRQYLADAVIWRPSGVPTPEQIRQGPPGRYPLEGVTPNADGEIACRYLRGGAGSPGRTAKFTCRTENGRSIRIKYYDGDVRTGNREVFAEVAATRLFWAVGFDADPMYPVAIRCLDCPSDPMSGTGPRASRRYLGVVEAFYEGTIISSGGDLNQGWRFGEISTAIAAMPQGEAQARQQMYFDALSLLAVFVQHGDRKPSQQRLVCQAPLDLSAGDVHPVDDDAGFHLPVLLERDGEKACPQSVLTIQDLGATFGGAGQFTLNVRAKVHLSSWAGTAMFANRAVSRSQPAVIPPCRGNIVSSSSAGPGAEDNPRIGDAGRRFLHERLSALTPDHVRAIFETARLDELDEPQQWRDPKTGRLLTGIDAWVGVFLHKVDEIGSVSCPA